MLKELLKKWTRRDVDLDKRHANGLPHVKNTPPMPAVKRPRASNAPLPKTVQHSRLYEELITKNIQQPVTLRKSTGVAGTAMDSTVAMDSQLNGFSYNTYNGIMPALQLQYFSNQAFIGYQLCAILSQHWLVSKCCLIPAQDAIRNGYEITVNDGTDVKPEILDEIKKLDVKYRLNHNLVQFVQLGRVFGIRIAMFQIDFDDADERKEYYENPFNIDAIKPHTYRGISQIDPYWMTFQLDDAAAGDPASINFYEPTWWVINGMKIHYTHLSVFRTEEVVDILKPTYFYGGIPIPQKIFNRVYSAERCASEAPLLLLTKRTSVINLDVAQAMAEESGDAWEPGFAQRMQQYSDNWNNFGVKTIGLEEEYSQHDTALADVDTVTMQQYQLVASAANVPALKLLGTSPKGFESTGTYEEASYHEELESIQTHNLTQLIERHHELLIRSEICPKFRVAPFSTTVVWAELDSMTADEQAEVNKKKAERDKILQETGAIDADEIRTRLIVDSESEYNGLEEGAPGLEEETEDKEDY